MTLRQQMSEAAAAVRLHSDLRPEVAIILGTGLGHLAEAIETAASIPYDQIPGFPASTVESHRGRMILGKLGGVQVVAMQGRFHYYEGYDMQRIAFPVRAAFELGARTLMVSNAAGGMNPHYRRGDLVLIEDHINLLGDNPLIGPNDDTLGPRFPDMSEPYSRELMDIAERVALNERIKLQKGVYVAVSGPNLETRAEYRFLRAVGADMVGMSTVPEVIVARHMAMRVLGLSIITDECFPDSLAPVDVAEIIAAANGAEPKLTAIVAGVLAEMGKGSVTHR